MEKDEDGSKKRDTSLEVSGRREEKGKRRQEHDSLTEVVKRRRQKRQDGILTKGPLDRIASGSAYHAT